MIGPMYDRWLRQPIRSLSPKLVSTMMGIGLSAGLILSNGAQADAQVLLDGLPTGPVSVPEASNHSNQKTQGWIQERIGERIQALARYDIQRRTYLNQTRREVIIKRAAFEAGGPARLQQELGQAIASTGRSLVEERTALEAELNAVRDIQRRLQSGGWLQERLGTAILQTAASSPPQSQDFMQRLEPKVRLLSIIQGRILQDMDERLVALTARRDQFPREALARLASAVEDAHRVTRFHDESYQELTGRVLSDTVNGLALVRGREDYRRLVDAVLATKRSHWGVAGFWEFGAPSLIGVILAMVWFGATTPGDLRWRAGEGTFEGRSRSRPSDRWKRELVVPQSTAMFSWPREVVFGSHCARGIGHYAARDRVKHAMILTDHGVVQQRLVEPVKESLSSSSVPYEVVDYASQEVPDTIVAQITDRCKQAGTDLLIAVGGGSVIDTAKAVGVLLTNGGSIQDYEGVHGIDGVSRPITPLYVVPTTAGCGSEASQFCIVLDTERWKKIEIFSRKLLPERIFIDPTMTCSMPPDLTASSGMEALANAIEAYFSTWASPLTDTLALDAMRLIAENLRAAVADGQNLEARQHMSLAAFEAGLAFTNAQAGAVHALGHSLAGLFGVPERIGDAILLPHVMKANMNADMWRMAKVAEAMGEPVEGLSVRAAAQRAIDGIKLLLVDVGLPTSLEEVGVGKDAISSLSAQAIQDTFLRTNPRTLDREDIEAIYEDAVSRTR